MQVVPARQVVQEISENVNNIPDEWLQPESIDNQINDEDLDNMNDLLDDKEGYNNTQDGKTVAPDGVEIHDNEDESDIYFLNSLIVIWKKLTNSIVQITF